MTGDEIGLHFYTEGQQAPGDRPSVFSGVDQDAMIARLEATEDDDLDSAFFGDSIQEVEDAAVRMFDVGIRTITQESATAAGSHPGEGAPPVGAASEPRPAVVTVAGDLAHDPAAQRAFILGGPAAIAD